MTRETKIGLLVGLAFIIVVGILLQDQMMRSVEPPAAQLGQAGERVRQGTATPASSHPPGQPIQTPQNVAPANPVRTREEIAPPAPPVTLVEIRPGVVAPANPGNLEPGATPGNLTNLVGGSNGGGPVAINGNNSTPMRSVPVDPRSRAPEGTRSLADIAHAMGEPLVGPDGQPLRATLPPAGPTDPSSLNPFGNRTGGGTGGAVASGGMKQYKAEPGDNLNRMAQKCYGSNTKAHRDLIVKANSSLAADPNKIIVGQTYNIPPAPAPGAPSAPATGMLPAPSAPAAPARGVAGEIWYTVRPGDNLTRIAKEQCGDASLVAAIKELNKETLQGGDRIVVSMKLRLPARPVASAN